MPSFPMQNGFASLSLFLNKKAHISFLFQSRFAGSLPWSSRRKPSVNEDLCSTDKQGGIINGRSGPSSIKSREDILRRWMLKHLTCYLRMTLSRWWEKGPEHSQTLIILKARQLTDREKNELDPDPDLCLKKELDPDLDRTKKSDRVKDQIPIPIFFPV